MKQLILIAVAIVMAGCSDYVKVWEHQIQWANKVCEVNGGTKQVYVEPDHRENFAGVAVRCNNGAYFEVSYRSQIEAVLNPGEGQ